MVGLFILSFRRPKIEFINIFLYGLAFLWLKNLQPPNYKDTLSCFLLKAVVLPFIFMSRQI